MSKKVQEKNFIRFRHSGTNLNNFSLGLLVGESDSNLTQYYVFPERYVDRACDFEDPAVFFIGAKGCGKSAILQMVRLRNERDARRVINISPDDLAFSSLANIEVKSPVFADVDRNQWLFKVLWDFTLCLEIARREFPDESMLARVLGSLFKDSHERDSRKLIELARDGSTMGFTDRILQLIREIELSGEYGGVKVSGKAEINDPPRTGALHLMNLVGSTAKQLPSKLHNDYYLLIDDLDVNWTNTPTQNYFIAGLFASLRHFSRAERLKCAVALRETIYRSLPLDDRDKYHDVVCDVRWDFDAVKAMVETRIIYALNIAANQIWDGLFPEAGFQQIWTHSLGRPREAIRLTELSIRISCQAGHSKVLDEDFRAALRQFSDERIREVTGEARYTFPGLEYLVRKMSGWKKQFPITEFGELVQYIAMEIDEGYPGSERLEWIRGYQDRPRDLVPLLAELGIFQLKASRTDTPRPFDRDHPFEFSADTWLSIHPMFGPALGLVGS